MVGADIRDSTGTFSPDAVRRANEIARQIRQQTERDVVLEVMPSLTSEQSAAYRADKDKFFQDWARSRARELGMSGIYMLMTRDPGHLEVAVGNQTAQQAFSQADRRELVQMMLGQFKQRQYDEGLVAGMQFIQATMQRNLGTAGAAPVPAKRGLLGGGQGEKFSGISGWMCLLIGLGVVLLAVWAFRRMRGSGRPVPGAYGGPNPGQPGGYGGYQNPGSQGGGFGGGGGGLGRGMLGGVLGGLGGGWLWDKLSGRGHQPGGSGTTGRPMDPEHQNPPPPDTDFSSGGGDFGGGDSGGGDSGGDSGGDF